VRGDPASCGIYSLRDAAWLTGVPRHRIRGWLVGYAQRRGRPAAGPVLCRQHPLRDGELALGFLDLLEVAFLGSLVRAAEERGRRPSWRAIRMAAERARRVLATDHPFALRRIYHTDGRSIFLETQKTTGDRALYDLVADNFALYDVVAASFIASVEYAEDRPRRWRPAPHLDRIVIDPLRAFGRPIEERSRVPAEALFDAWRAERGDEDRVAAWFETDAEGVRQAVGFMQRSHAPAARAA
jgi:uncharacterized protein (DUF433 family)